MKTDYAGHDRAYQRRQNNPEYAGWMKYEELLTYSRHQIRDYDAGFSLLMILRSQR